MCSVYIFRNLSTLGVERYSRWYIIVIMSKNNLKLKRCFIIGWELTWDVYLLKTTKWKALQVILITFVKLLHLKSGSLALFGSYLKRHIFFAFSAVGLPSLSLVWWFLFYLTYILFYVMLLFLRGLLFSNERKKEIGCRWEGRWGEIRKSGRGEL